MGPRPPGPPAEPSKCGAAPADAADGKTFQRPSGGRHHGARVAHRVARSSSIAHEFGDGWLMN